MSSKKGYSPERCDDCNCDVAVATPDQTSGSYVEYHGELPDTTENREAKVATKTKVSNEEFVKAWMSCDSYAVMSFNTGMTVSAVQARATRLRKAMVQLPSFTRATRKKKEIDVAGLNDMIETNTETYGEIENE